MTAIDATVSTLLPALSFAGVGKCYAGTPALTDVSLAVSAGTITGLVGVNGAGKTTLLKCLLDFCSFNTGSIMIFGSDSRQTRARARIAFLPERFVPPYYLTGRDFLRHLLELYGVIYQEPQATTCLARLDLHQSALAKPVRDYSKGMTQKLGLAACLLSGRDILLFDEPTSGLDPKARALLKAELKHARQAGRTVFFTSHALADVEELCDTLAVLHDGGVRFDGTPAQLKSAYQSSDMEAAYLSCIGG